MQPVYNLALPTAAPLPIVLSIPHCGTAFPDDIMNEYKAGMLPPDDTDWFVQQLYDFAPAMGITVISAVYSRWVIDLNRNPASIPLYNDGRIITGLCPATNFLGEPIYKDERQAVDAGEMQRRLTRFFHPYHNKLQRLLTNIKNQFGQVLLWDCHSIRQLVPTIYNQPFPDLILGDADETSASQHIINAALEGLQRSGVALAHNHPFKGGYITRHFGQPQNNQHALQLEMTKVNYMDDAETAYDADRAEKMRNVLRQTFEVLGRVMV